MTSRGVSGGTRADCPVCDSDAAFLRSSRPPYEAFRPPLRVVDLFAGCGGLTLGVAEAARKLGLGIDVRLAADIDKDAVTVFRTNLPAAAVRHSRVEELFDGEIGAARTSVERRLARQVGPVDVLVGGPPCQGHSNLNNHTRRDDPRNLLYAKMARAAEVLRPTFVLVENVPMVTHDVEKVVAATVEALHRAEYQVAERVVDLGLLGAPQRRRRHVVFASRSRKVDPSTVLDPLDHRCPVHETRSVRWAIGDLVRVPPEGLFDSWAVPSPVNVERIAWLFKKRRYDLPNDRRPKCHRSDHSYVSMYGRLKWDDPAQTVTTGFSSMGQGRYVHPARRRTITPHEAARLQMLPDFWDFSSVGTQGGLARLIGNAVPPVLTATILERALRLLSPSLAPVPEVASSTAIILGGDRARRLRRKAADSSRMRRAGVPLPSSPEAERRMKATRRRDTAAEKQLQAELDRVGLTYLIDASAVPGSRRRVDVLFPDARVAVFVDGCFWHGCPAHETRPRANGLWWQAKLKANRKRDADTDRELHESGWVVLRFWEHEDPRAAGEAIASVLARRQSRKRAGSGPAENRGARRVGQ